MRDDMVVQWAEVMEYMKSAQEKGTDAVTWSLQLSAAMASAGVAPPSPELAHVLVSHLCWANDVPLAWKYIEKALAAGLVPPMLLLALLSSRLGIPPAAREVPNGYFNREMAVAAATPVAGSSVYPYQQQYMSEMMQQQRMMMMDIPWLMGILCQLPSNTCTSYFSEENTRGSCRIM